MSFLCTHTQWKWLVGCVLRAQMKCVHNCTEMEYITVSGSPCESRIILVSPFTGLCWDGMKAAYIPPSSPSAWVLNVNICTTRWLKSKLSLVLRTDPKRDFDGVLCFCTLILTGIRILKERSLEIKISVVHDIRMIYVELFLGIPIVYLL